MVPTKDIDPAASQINNFTVMRGILFHHNEPVETCPSMDAGRAFVQFLASFSTQVIVVGNNFKTFDAPPIVDWLEQLGLLQEFCDIVYGITETMPLIGDKDSSALGVLSKRYFTGPEWRSIILDAHDALADCKLLQGLLDYRQVTDKEIQKKSVSMREFCHTRIVNRIWKSYLPSLAGLAGHISKGMINKMAKAGVTLNELKRVFSVHGENGVTAYLAAEVNEKARVTKTKKIFSKIVDYVEALE